MKILLALIIFSLIIVIHELGHFLLAKRGGIRVNEFSLGMGPRILSKQIGETRYSLKLLPFGGSCMMEGEDGYNPETDAPGSMMERTEVVDVLSGEKNRRRQAVLVNGIPEDSRAAGHSQFLNAERITKEQLDKVRSLNEIAGERGQSLAQMALVWALEKGKLTSVILGASRLSQIEENVKALENSGFTEEELTRIEAILR